MINDDETDDTSCDINNDTAGTKTVVQKISTFLDIDFDLDNNIQELNVSREEQSDSKINVTVNSNINSKSTRASGRLRSRGKSQLSSDSVTSKLTSSATPPQNKKGKVSSKGISAASQSTVPMTLIDDGKKIMDQKANEISAKKKRSKRMPN